VKGPNNAVSKLSTVCTPGFPEKGKGIDGRGKHIRGELQFYVHEEGHKRGQDRKTGHINLTFRHVQHQRGQGFKQGMVEGGVGGVGTHAGEQDTTVNNTQCQQEMVVKKNPKEKGNRNNGQTKIKRIVKNKLLSKLPSKISKRKSQ